MNSTDDNSALIQAFRKNPGGVGNFLNKEQKDSITEGPPNAPESNDPYNLDKLLAGANDFFEDHPLKILSGKDDARN